MRFFYYAGVKPVEICKRVFLVKTWVVESAFVFFVLATVAIATHRDPREWLGVLAVEFTFLHASVANRLEEREAKRAAEKGYAEVECYRWLQRYFYSKEVVWFAYFFLTGAYSALVGVFVFFFYGRWRALWRQYHALG